MRIAFQGEPGAYSESAVIEYFGKEVNSVPCESFETVFDQVNSGKSDQGLIPIENSVAGSIHRNYDLLLQNSLSIVGEYHLRVKHCLIGYPGTQISQIHKVISHPQALAQCDRFLHSIDGIKIEPAYDTAGSVKIIHDTKDMHTAAIASARAAQEYGMSILAQSIEDNPANYTRFLAIAHEAIQPDGDTKTSIVFSLDNQPGALFKALSVFALRDIDLMKIESRPLVGTPWEYYFYIDLAGSTNTTKVQRALEHLNEYAVMLRILGSYQRHRLIVNQE